VIARLAGVAAGASVISIVWWLGADPFCGVLAGIAHWEVMDWVRSRR